MIIRPGFSKLKSALFNNNKGDVENANDVKSAVASKSVPVAASESASTSAEVPKVEYDILKQNVGKIKTLIYRVSSTPARIKSDAY